MGQLQTELNNTLIHLLLTTYCFSVTGFYFLLNWFLVSMQLFLNFFSFFFSYSLLFIRTFHHCMAKFHICIISFATLYLFYLSISAHFLFFEAVCHINKYILSLSASVSYRMVTAGVITNEGFLIVIHNL